MHEKTVVFFGGKAICPEKAVESAIYKKVTRENPKVIETANLLECFQVITQASCSSETQDLLVIVESPHIIPLIRGFSRFMGFRRVFTASDEYLFTED